MHSDTLRFLFVLLLSVDEIVSINLADRVIHAVNCGGDEHLGSNGILYSADYTELGIASDFGSKYEFVNAPEGDRELYQTERYADHDLIYNFPLLIDGDYVIVLKFSEVYFTSPRNKVFDVKLNGLTVIEQMDIVKETSSPGFAYDRYIEFSVKGQKLRVGSMVGYISGTLQVIFVKGDLDNPKVNAIALIRGKATDLPPPPTVPKAIMDRDEVVRRRQLALPSYPANTAKEGKAVSEKSVEREEDQEEEEEDEEERAKRKGVASGPPARNPFDSKTDNWTLIVVVVLIFLIPLVHFLRKL